MKLKTTYRQLKQAAAGRLLPAFILLCIVAGAAAQDNSLTVVANEKGAPSQIKMAELKSVLMGEKQRWSNGTKVVIALMKTSTPLGILVSKRIYDMSGDEVKSFWLRMSFAGKGDAPKFCNTEEELLAYIAENEGAIGVLDKSSDMHDIKTVSVDGKKSF